MSISEKLAQLTSIRTAIRTALTAKGVTDAGTHNYADFADDIGSIESGTPVGESIPEMYAKTISFDRAIVDEDINLKFSNITSANSMFRRMKFNGHKLNATFMKDITVDYFLANTTGATEVTLTAPKITGSGYMMFGSDSSSSPISCEKITINADTSKITDFQYAFRTCIYLESIIGELDLSSSTNNSMFYASGARMLKDVTFKANTISASMNIDSGAVLTNESLISIANGLKDGVDGKTLKLHATSKAKCNTIIGTVTTVDSVNTFTADESGTVTLADFITNYKGWTLA